MRTGQFLYSSLKKTRAVVGPALAAGTIAITLFILFSLRPVQTNIFSTDEAAKEQAFVVVRPPFVLENTISREHCHYNNNEDVRVCTDLDTLAKHRDVKDVNGNWSLGTRE
jgi:hypothetical protein